MNWIKTTDKDHQLLSMGEQYIIFSEDHGVMTAIYKPYMGQSLWIHEIDRKTRIQGVTHYMCMPKQPEGTKRIPSFAESMEGVMEYLEKLNEDPTYHEPTQYLTWCCDKHEKQ